MDSRCRSRARGHPRIPRTHFRALVLTDSVADLAGRSEAPIAASPRGWWHRQGRISGGLLPTALVRTRAPVVGDSPSRNRSEPQQKTRIHRKVYLLVGLQRDNNSEDHENKDMKYALVDDSPRSVLLRKPDQSTIHQ